MSRIEPHAFRPISSKQPSDAKSDWPKRVVAQPLSVNHHRPHAFLEATGDLGLNDRVHFILELRLGRIDGFIRGQRKDSSFFEDIEVSLLADSPVAVVFAPVTVLLKAGFELFRSRPENLLTSVAAPSFGAERARGTGE